MKPTAQTTQTDFRLWNRIRKLCVVFVLAFPLLLGWHPAPTLGSIAEVSAVLVVALCLTMVPVSARTDRWTFLLGTGGLLVLLFLRVLASPVTDQVAYAGLWIGPLVVVGVGLIVCWSWPQTGNVWLRVLAGVLLLVALVNALIGFLQYWRVAAFFDAFGPFLVYWDRDDGVAHGNVAQRNVLATLCLLGLTASIFLNPRQRTTVRLLELFLAYAMVLTASRTPLLIVCVLVAVAAYRLRSWTLLQSALVMRLVVPVLALQLLGPFLNDLVAMWIQRAPVESAASRLGSVGLGIRAVFYQLAAEIGSQWWVWGGGWKSLPAAMVERGFAHGVWGVDELPTHAHNLLLHLWAEIGLPLALLATLYPLWLMLRRGAETAEGNFARLSLAVMWTHSMVEFPLWQPALFFMFVGLCRALEVAHQTSAIRTVPAGMNRWGVVFRAATLSVTLGASLTAWQLVQVAQLWPQIIERRDSVQTGQLAALRENPVVEPYADWLELNLNADTPQRRVAHLERLAQWIPDSMMLGLLADAYRQAERPVEAQAIERRRAVVFGIELSHTR